eukprot:53112_1
MEVTYDPYLYYAGYYDYLDSPDSYYYYDDNSHFDPKNPWIFDRSYYPFSDCDPSPTVSISVTPDTQDLSGVYQIKHCGGYEHRAGVYAKRTACHDSGWLLVYEWMGGDWYISDVYHTFMAIDHPEIVDTTPKAICTPPRMNGYLRSVSNCVWTPTDVASPVPGACVTATISLLSYVGIPLSIIFLIILIIMIRKYDVPDLTNQPDLTQSTPAEMQQHSDTKQSQIGEDVEGTQVNKEQTEEGEETSSFDRAFIGQCILLFVIKPAVEIYDYYMDFTLGRIWLDYYVSDIHYNAYGTSLLVTATIGFVIGVVGHIYMHRPYFAHKTSSHPSLGDVTQSNVWCLCVLAKIILEDVVAIAIFICVSNKGNGLNHVNWFVAYCSSCVGLMLGETLLIRKIFMSSIPTKIGGILVVFLVVTSIALPLYPIGNYWWHF